MAAARSTLASPYYPPRARWYGFLFRRVDALFWRFNLDPGASWEESTLTAVAAFLVPGLAFYLRGPRWLGKAALAACAGLLAVFVVFLGQPAAAWAVAALLSIHASGVLHRARALIGKFLFYRMCASMAVTLILLCCVYLPLRFLIERYLVMPLTVNGHAMILRTRFSPSDLRRGGWIAYQLSMRRARFGDANGSDLDVGQVVALPGDAVELAGQILLVNGVAQPPIDLLVGERTIIVPPGYHLVRPRVGISVNHAFPNPAALTNALLENDLVPDSRVVGEPLPSWFGKRQTLR